MENATKALVMAGVVLVAIMVLTMGVNLVGKLGQTADSYNARLSASEIQKYNSSFEVFIGREDVTAQEIVTLINLTQQSHQGTAVIVDGVNCTSDWIEQDKKDKFLENNILTYSIDDTGKLKTEGLYIYVDESIEYDNDGKVKTIKFKKNR